MTRENFVENVHVLLVAFAQIICVKTVQIIHASGTVFPISKKIIKNEGKCLGINLNETKILFALKYTLSSYLTQ